MTGQGLEEVLRVGIFPKIKADLDKNPRGVILLPKSIVDSDETFNRLIDDMGNSGYRVENVFEDNAEYHIAYFKRK